MNWIRWVYLYAFALLGLILITIGSVQLVGLGLRSYVLTEADAEMRIRHFPDPPMRLAPDRLEQDTTLDPATRQALRLWAEDYDYLYHWRIIRRERVAPRT